MSKNIQQSQKVENITTQKNSSIKKNSYTYWVDNKNKSRQLPPEQRPQKIEAPQIQNTSNESGRSHWNTAGTWQHKAISLKQIQKQYENNIVQWISQYFSDIIIKKIQLNGQCEIVYIRNKKALTYQINGKIEFQKNNIEDNNLQKSQTSPKNQQKQQKLSDSTSSQEIKSNKRTLTLQILDFTDIGDRQYKCLADDKNDKIFISNKAEDILKILQDIIKKYK